jgi:transposase
VVRHRLSRAGDRQLNQALHLIALVQLRDDTPSRACFRRKLAEGKSSREALRCVKRRVSDQVYRVMSADERSAVQPVSTAAT